MTYFEGYKEQVLWKNKVKTDVRGQKTEVMGQKTVDFMQIKEVR